MKYTYDFYDNGNNRVRTDTTCPDHFDYNSWCYILVTNNLSKVVADIIESQDDLDGWSEAIQREFSWGDAYKKKEWDVNESTPKNITHTDTQPKYTLGEITGNMPLKNHIDPPHYQAMFVVPDFLELQWLEHLQYHAHFKNPEVFKGAVELQARKYLDRCGGKDDEAQELMKCIWYLKFLAAYIKNCNSPIYISDIPKLLRDLK